ncbi:MULTISPECIES: hypothetical protein [Microbacterium]|uniref:hypothetical protein n=1 Tax=Microbacterium TaxID=33882 RepID=UPI001FFCAE4D|nr:hypothetical protein [Microbacterium sp. KSW4-4]MCK2031762.1 hypothetical protein [Microbacterium sp. KSW4-4]
MTRFYSAPHRYQQNINDGHEAAVTPAVLQNPTGATEPGIAIIVGRLPKLVIPTSDAIRIATDIADAATNQNRN